MPDREVKFDPVQHEEYDVRANWRNKILHEEMQFVPLELAERLFPSKHAKLKVAPVERLTRGAWDLHVSGWDWYVWDSP